MGANESHASEGITQTESPEVDWNGWEGDWKFMGFEP